MAEKLHCPKNAMCRDMKQSHFSALSHPAFEELIRKQLDNGDLTLPETIPFGRNDRMMLLRQLKNLQKVMKKERDVSSSRQSTAVNPITEQSLNESADDEKNKSTKRAAASSPVSVDLKKTRKSETFNKSVSLKDLKKSLLKEYESCESQASRDKLRKDAIKKLEASKQLPHLESPGNFLIKYKKAAPYFVFLSSIEDSPETWKQSNSITFPEILDKSFGEIEESLHITDKVDIGWLCLQYLLAGQKTDSTILCSRRIDKTSLSNTIRIYNFDQKSKITMLKYKNGARIVIPSANLYSDDWYYRTQTVWISPHLPYLSKNSNSAEGESKTGFKQTFTKYLMALDPESNAKINIAKWLGLCSTLDFSMINVFFIGCVPGKSYEWGLSNLAELLMKHVTFRDLDEWPIVIQNSITTNFSFGNKYWLDHELTYELSFCKGREWGDADEYSNQNNPELHFIYPTKKNFENSSDPLAQKTISTKKKYPLPHSDWKIIEPYSHQWKSKSHARDRVMPGCNYYTRISPDMDKVPWIVITSSNLGDFSWGYKFNDERENRKDYSYRKLRMYCNNEFEPLLGEYLETHIDNFAAGILFLPKFLTGQATFPIQEIDENGILPFPVPFDFPLKEYNRADEPLVFKDYSGDVKDCIFKKRTKVSVAAVSKRYDYPSSPEPSDNSDDSDDCSDKENKCVLS